MTAVTQERRQLRETPFRAEAEARHAERMERASAMPKDLPSLLRWFDIELRNELPDAIHGSTVWRDQVTGTEAKEGLRPVGASETGALAYVDEFRRRIENAPSEVDLSDHGTDGRVYFIRPIAAAISRIARQGKPFMARHLLLLAAAGCDWRRRADAIGWTHEEYEIYIREALIRLWREHREWVRSA